MKSPTALRETWVVTRVLARPLLSGGEVADPDDLRPAPEARFALAWSRLAAEDARRAEWLAQNARVPDPDEADEELRCKVCDGPVISSRAHPRPMVCRACGEKGWRAAPCKRCGGVTHKRDQMASRWLKGICGPCRATIRASLDGQPEAA